MLVIYHYYWDATLALLAAIIHLRKIKFGRKPTTEEIQHLNNSLPVVNFQKGIVYPLGTDESNNQICVLSRGKNPKIMVNALLGTALISGVGEKVFFVDTDQVILQNKKMISMKLLCVLARFGMCSSYFVGKSNAIYLDLTNLVQSQKEILSLLCLKKGEMQ